MKITSLQEYGMRCLLQLAETGGDKPMQIRAIAEKEGLSQDYVGKILTRLRRAGFVRSLRGLNGGYIMVKKPSEVSVGNVINALSENPIQQNHLKRDLCGQFPGNRKECVHMRTCNVRQIWSMVIVQVYGSLNRIPLSSLIGSEAEVQSNLIEFMKSVPAAGAKEMKEEVSV